METVLVFAAFAFTLTGLFVFQDNPARVFGAASMFLLASGLVDEKDVIASVSNNGLMVLVLLMLCSLVLEKTRVLRLIASGMIKASYRSTWLRLFFAVSLLSSVFNNTAVVATLLGPIRNNPYHSASKLLIPLSYAAILGGTMTLLGTSTNLVVSSMLLEAGGQSLGFFDFTLLGMTLVCVCGIGLYLVSLLLPDNKVDADNAHGYFLDGLVTMGSKLAGKTVEEAGLRHLESLFLVEIVRDQQLISPVSPNEPVKEGDRLIFSGDIKKVHQLLQFQGLELFMGQNELLCSNLGEVVVRPESVLVGQAIRDTGFRARFNAAVVAVRRSGEPVSGKLGDLVLRAGDFLVLAVGADFQSRQNIEKNFILLRGCMETTQPF